jgi:hypothetical protein
MVVVGQPTQYAAATGDHRPAAHVVHAACAVWPGSGCAVPAAHAVQALLPVAAQVPGPHRSHLPVSAFRMKPALHTHPVLFDPAGAVELAGHGRQVWLPSSAKVLAWQVTHALALAPE